MFLVGARGGRNADIIALGLGLVFVSSGKGGRKGICENRKQKNLKNEDGVGMEWKWGEKRGKEEIYFICEDKRRSKIYYFFLYFFR